MLFDLPKQALREFADAFGNKGESMNESQLKSLLESFIRKCNLVSREEFDAQRAVLLRTREKLEALEKQVAELEIQTHAKP